METITITLPLPPESLSPNCSVGSLGGRLKKASDSKKYRLLTALLVMQEQVETAPWDTVEVKAIFHHATNRRRDQDNAIASLKAAYDGIVDSGLVPDDDWRHMVRMQPEFHIDKQQPRVTIEIRRLA